MTKDRNLLITNLLLILSLFFLPFVSFEDYPAWQQIIDLEFSNTFWNLAQESNLLYIIILLLTINIPVYLLQISSKLKAKILLVLNSIGVIFFIWYFFFAFSEEMLSLGATFIFAGFLIFIGNAFTKLGLIKADTFVSSSILILSTLLFIFILYPLIIILKMSVTTEEGMVVFSQFIEIILDNPNFSQTFFNSLITAITVAFTSTLIGLSFALVINRTQFKFVKKFLRVFSILPIITPPFVIGLAIIYMLGLQGYVTKGLLGLENNFIYGFVGLVLAQTLSFAPISFLVLSGVLESLDSALEEASLTLGAGKWQSFKTVIWPLIRPGVANAFLLSIIESLADFGNPMIIGGDFDVLATSIYFAITGQYDFPLAATLGITLLSLTLIAYLLQRFWIGKKSYVTVTGKPSQGANIPLSKTLDAILTAFTFLWSTITIWLYGSVFYGGLVQLWGIDNTFTFKWYENLFSEGLDSFKTSIELALISAPISTGIGILIAYLVIRQRFFGKGAFEFTSMLSFAIPGTVIGVGYVMSFNDPPLLLTGTGLVIILCFVFRNMPVGIRSGVASLQQIDISLEESSITLGAGNGYTLWKIVLPLIKSSISSGLIFSFVRGMTAISAVIFLITPETRLATTDILAKIEEGFIGTAAAYCSILILFMGSMISILYLITDFLLKRKDT